MSKLEHVEEWAKRGAVLVQFQETANASDLFTSNRCYEVKLSRLRAPGIYTWLYCYMDKRIVNVAVSDILLHLAKEAQTYEGEPHFNLWNKQLDNGKYVEILGRELAAGYYHYCKETYESFLRVLSPDLFIELLSIVKEVG